MNKGTSEPRVLASLQNPQFLIDLRLALNEISISDCQDKADWDYDVDVGTDGSILITSNAVTNRFDKCIYHTTIFATDESGRLSIEDDLDEALRDEFGEFGVVSAFEQVGDEMQQNVIAIHKAMVEVAAKHSVPISLSQPRFIKGGSRIAMEAMLTKFPNDLLMAEFIRRSGARPSA